MTNPRNLGAYAGGGVMFRNKIINGAMTIDQRNAGASVTPATGSLAYATDRFGYSVSQSSKLTAQQSSTAPTGFVNSLLTTSSSAYSVTSTEVFNVRQYIEGVNCADLSWGTASASPVTLSFWVRSSLTGTFGGSITNNAQDRFYVFSYTISAANTWEQKTITIAGDTTGTWLTTTGRGISILWSLGTGSTYCGAAGSWGSTLYRSVTGETSVVGTNGATFYITGVQLEKGSTATSFDFRSYGQELALCQRYYQKQNSTTAYVGFGYGNAANSTNGQVYVKYTTTMRANPTASYQNLELADGANAGVTVTSLAAGYFGPDAAALAFNVASGLTQYRPYILEGRNTNDGYLAFSAEL